MATHWTPSPWFLITPPQPRPGTVHRARIDAALATADARGVTAVVMAPSGYGKTTALAEWAAGSPSAVAWITLTRHDHSAHQVLAGIFNALQRMARGTTGFHAILDVVPDPTDTPLMLERVSRALREAPQRVTVIVDDAHLATPALADEVVSVLSEHSGGNVRFVIAGTHSLDAWFNAQIAHGTAVVIGHEALAMTVTEIDEFAAHVSAALPEQTTRAIHEDTQGWPVAIRIALSTDAARGETGSGALAAGDLLTEYISTTVLQDLRPELVDFVLAVTTCSRVTAALAEALSGRSDAAVLLDECVRQGLFIDRYVEPDQDPVYRWHEVFARNCRIAVARADAQRARELNRTAAGWLTASFPIEATVYAMRAGAPEMAVQILRDRWVPLLIESGAAALNARCLALPSEWAEDPEILLIRASCRDVQGDASGAEILAARATAKINAATAPPGAQLRHTRAFAELFLAHDHPTLARAADQVNEVLRTTSLDHHAHTHALFLLGWVELRLRRDPAGAVQLLASARDEAAAGGHPLLARRAAQNLLFAYAFGGLFTAARNLERETAARAEQDDAREWQHYDAGIDYFARGFITYWQNDLVAAEAQFRFLIDQGGHDTSYTALARVFFALTAAATNDARLRAEAHAHLTGVSTAEAHGVPWPIYRAIGGAMLAAAAGDSPRVLAVIEPISQTTSVPMTSVLMAELFRRAGHPASALRVLARIPRREQVSFVRASALVTSAVISRQAGDRERSHAHLERALDLAAPESIARPFNASADDDALRELLTEHAVWGTAHEGFLAAQLAHSTDGVSRAQVLGAALSPRERDIFGYLRTTMTAEEIASALHVSVNTVRTHQRAIYRKLGVNTRREAIKLRI